MDVGLVVPKGIPPPLGAFDLLFRCVLDNLAVLQSLLLGEQENIPLSLSFVFIVQQLFHKLGFTLSLSLSHISSHPSLSLSLLFSEVAFPPSPPPSSTNKSGDTDGGGEADLRFY
ncbi:hypothetical protein L1887_36758 [Cichorium endivia]|nr:hypothetical protein L1887_36758 [Cichorium endivia]